MPRLTPRLPHPRPAAARPRSAASLVALLLGVAAALGAGPAAAQSMTRAPVISVGSGEGSSARRIELGIGKSVIVDLPRDAKEVFVADPKIANAVVRSARKLFLIGMGDGQTSIFALDADGNQIATFEINIGKDLNVLRQMYRTAMPTSNIQVTSVGNSIVLLGAVDSPLEAKRAEEIAFAWGGRAGATGGGANDAAAGNGGTSYGTVINSIKIRGRDQVMVKVTIAEIQRSVIKQLGIDLGNSWSIGRFNGAGLTSNPPGVNPTAIGGLAIAGSLGRFNSNFPNATLRALERAGVMRTLAEPTLTAISGESAKFTAGGEIPIPATSDRSRDADGVPIDRLGVVYKPIGVSLNITPVVLSEGRISVRVSTEVSEVDTENQIRINQINVPGIRVRKADTTIELPSGGSLVTAGLLQTQSRQAMVGTPGLINLPILGALFRSRDYLRNETELMIVVTPFIAKPMEPRQVVRPDEGFVDASDPQAVLLGRVNRIYGVAGATAPVPYKGRAGFVIE